MADILRYLSGTSAPSLLMGLGAVLLLLAFVQKIGTQLEMPRERQGLAAIVGTLLLAFGIGLHALPGIVPILAAEPAQTQQQVTDVVPQSALTTLLPDPARVKAIHPGVEADADVFTQSTEELASGWSGREEEFADLLAGSGHRGVGLAMEGDCEEPGALLIIDSFPDQTTAENYWRHAKNALEAESDELRVADDGALLDAWKETCDETEIFAHGRHRLYRNLVILVYLTAPTDQVSSADLEERAATLAGDIVRKADQL